MSYIHTYSWEPALAGVPQWFTLGPLLFVMCISELTKKFPSISKLFPVDTSDIFSVVKDVKLSQDQLNRNLDILAGILIENSFHSLKNTFAFLSLTPSCLRSQFLWFNSKPFHLQGFSKENINFVEHLCKMSRVFKSWNETKTVTF